MNVGGYDPPEGATFHAGDVPSGCYECGSLDLETGTSCGVTWTLCRACDRKTRDACAGCPRRIALEAVAEAARAYEEAREAQAGAWARSFDAGLEAGTRVLNAYRRLRVALATLAEVSHG